MPSSDWNDLCTSVIVWERLLTRDSYGKPATFSAAQTFRGRRVFTRRRVSSQANGQAVDVMSASQIWILGIPDIQPDDRVYVSGDTDYPPIVSIDRFPDEDGDHHVKINMGSFKG